MSSVFHPSDFSDASETAFVHALRIAVATGARLNMLHVASEAGDADERDFPNVAAALGRWHCLPQENASGTQGQLGIEVRAAVTSSDEPVEASLEFLSRHPADLIVLAVHQYDGRTRWVKERVGTPIAQEAGEMTLFVPHGVPGFVSREDGSLSLRNVLIPIASQPRPQAAIDAAVCMVRSLGAAAGVISLLHVGPAEQAPHVTVPRESSWLFNQIAADGEPGDVIVQVADTTGAALIVMTTEGPHGFLDGLRGSTSERVLRRTRCPVMTLPAQLWSSRTRRFWVGQHAAVSTQNGSGMYLKG